MTVRTIAVDIGGTSIRAAAGDLGAPRSVPTPAGGDGVVAAVVELVAPLVSPEVAAVGVVVPGVVDDAGVVAYATNLGWRDVPLRRLLAAELGLPVVVCHDVAAAAAAEAGSTDADLLFVALGTGVAAVHIQVGRAARGATDAAGELGHIPVYPDGDKCACGQFGCLEAYASAAAIARRYAASGGDPSYDAARIVAALPHDALAQQVWTQATEALGLALTTATLLLDPGAVVLGGGLSLAGDRLLAPVAAELTSRLAWRNAPPLRLSRFGAAAGLHGAARLARELVEANRVESR
jgi:glucokinase